MLYSYHINLFYMPLSVIIVFYKIFAKQFIISISLWPIRVINNEIKPKINIFFTDMIYIKKTE